MNNTRGALQSKKMDKIGKNAKRQSRQRKLHGEQFSEATALNSIHLTINRERSQGNFGALFSWQFPFFVLSLHQQTTKEAPHEGVGYSKTASSTGFRRYIAG